MSLQIPLVKGESVLTPGVEVQRRPGAGRTRRRRTELGLAFRACRVPRLWSSLYPRTPRAARSGNSWSIRSGTWSSRAFRPSCRTTWPHPMWVFRFVPRPGEKLSLKVTRPHAVSGTTLAIDRVLQRRHRRRIVRPRLELKRCRSQHQGWPPCHPAARGRARDLGGCSTTSRSSCGRRRASCRCRLTPGKHNIVVRSGSVPRGRRGARIRPSLDLRAPASNVQYALRLPDSRWPLAAWGTGIGPAVLYWAELGAVHRHRLVARPLVALTAAFHRVAAAGPGPVDSVLGGVHVHRNLAAADALARALATRPRHGFPFQRRAGRCSRCSRCTWSRSCCSRASAMACWKRRTWASSINDSVTDVSVVCGPHRRRGRVPDHHLRADVAVPRVVPSPGRAGWRSHWCAGCAGRSTPGEATASGAPSRKRRNCRSPRSRAADRTCSCGAGHSNYWRPAWLRLTLGAALLAARARARARAAA